MGGKKNREVQVVSGFEEIKQDKPGTRMNLLADDGTTLTVEFFGLDLGTGTPLQIINVVSRQRPEPKAPAFDVEEYRADLQSRLDNLIDLETTYHRAWRVSQQDTDYRHAQRNRNKARGLEIALSLLPPKED